MSWTQLFAGHTLLKGCINRGDFGFAHIEKGYCLDAREDIPAGSHASFWNEDLEAYEVETTIYWRHGRE